MRCSFTESPGASCLLLQLFWPDDGMWYLIDIHKIDLRTRTAT